MTRPTVVAARLRDGSRGEWLVRLLMALLFAVSLRWQVDAVAERPRRVVDVTPLLQDANAGRVVQVDDSSSAEVRWRDRDGTEYVAYGVAGIDVKRSVLAQPYVQQHPRTIRAGYVGRDHHNGWVRFAMTLAYVVALAKLVGSVPPRHLTKWGWFWTFFLLTPLPYLLLGGSSRHLDHGPPRRRLSGWWVLLVVAVLRHAEREHRDRLAEWIRPSPARGGAYAPAVPEAPA